MWWVGRGRRECSVVPTPPQGGASTPSPHPPHPPPLLPVHIATLLIPQPKNAIDYRLNIVAVRNHHRLVRAPRWVINLIHVSIILAATSRPQLNTLDTRT